MHATLGVKLSGPLNVDSARAKWGSTDLMTPHCVNRALVVPADTAVDTSTDVKDGSSFCAHT